VWLLADQIGAAARAKNGEPECCEQGLPAEREPQISSLCWSVSIISGIRDFLLRFFCRSGREDHYGFPNASDTPPN